MEWIVEGVALISTAAVVAVATAIDRQAAVASAAHAVAAGRLIVLAIISLSTGFGIASCPSSRARSSSPLRQC